MAAYTTDTLTSLGVTTTSFRGEEVYVTFYKESDYSAGKKRSAMNPVVDYLYINGVSVSDAVVEHPRLQAYGSRTQNLRAPAYVESSLSISGLYAQEDASWMAPGHPPLIAFIDFIDSDRVGKKSKDDVLNSNLDYVQTIVVRDVVRKQRAINAQGGSSASHTVEFSCGEVVSLAPGIQDL